VPFTSTRRSGRYRADWVIGAGAVPGPASGDRDAGSAYVPIWAGGGCADERRMVFGEWMRVIGELWKSAPRRFMRVCSYALSSRGGRRR
jgi:hypothetical protein